MDWSKLEHWSNRDPDTGAFLGVPPGLGVGQRGVMLVEPVGRLAMDDTLVVCDVLHETNWDAGHRYMPGDRLLVYIPTQDRVEFGSPGVLRDYVVVLKEDGCRVCGKFDFFEPSGGSDEAGRLESDVNGHSSQPSERKRKPRTRAPKNNEVAILVRPGGVTRWFELVCGHCGEPDVVSASFIGPELKHGKVGWRRWSLPSPVKCSGCGTRWGEAEELSDDGQAQEEIQF